MVSSYEVFSATVYTQIQQFVVKVVSIHH